MFQVKARTSVVVIGEHVLHVDQATHFPDGVPPEVSERTDLVEIIEIPDADPPASGLTADGVDHSAGAGGDGHAGQGTLSATSDTTSDDDGTKDANLSPEGGEAEVRAPLDPDGLDDAGAGVTLLHVDDEEEDGGAGGEELHVPDPFAEAPAPPAAAQPAAVPSRPAAATLRGKTGRPGRSRGQR